jgi:hypothetical protein
MSEILFLLYAMSCERIETCCRGSYATIEVLLYSKTYSMWQSRETSLCNGSLCTEIRRVLANGVADPFGGYETVSTRVDGLSTAGKPGIRSARESGSEAGAIDVRVKTRMEREALQEARCSRYARYERTRRSGKRLATRGIRDTSA